MARKQYPSDRERLKRRPSVSVHLSIQNHPKYAHVFADPVKRGMWLGLMVVAGRAYANRTDDFVTLTSADVAWVSGRSQFKSGASSLQVLCKLLGYSCEVGDKFVVVGIRNFAKKQGFTTRLRGVTPPTPHASEVRSQKSESDKEVAPPSEALLLSDLLKEKVLELNPKSKPKTATWAKTIDQMHRIDGRSWSEIKHCIDWVFGANQQNEASFVVLSASALRAKFDRMWISASRHRPEPPKISPSPIKTPEERDAGIAAIQRLTIRSSN